MQKSPEYADTVGIQEEGTRPDASPAQNELYADFIVKYMGNFQEDRVLAFRKSIRSMVWSMPRLPRWEI